MRSLTPISATIRYRDGRTEHLDQADATTMYCAHRATCRAPWKLRELGGRQEFERSRQVKIQRWLADHERPELERAMIIGDSIRMRQGDTTGYGLHAYRHLLGRFNLSHVSFNTGHSGLVREHVDDWMTCRPNVVHFNAGLHDLSTNPKTAVLPWWHNTIDQYQRNLDETVDHMRSAGVRRVVWASSTPVHDGWHNLDVRTGKTRAVLRNNADVLRYNAAAAEVMHEKDVEINDLYTLVVETGIDHALLPDGVHLSHVGSAILGQRVADVMLQDTSTKE